MLAALAVPVGVGAMIISMAMREMTGVTPPALNPRTTPAAMPTALLSVPVASSTVTLWPAIINTTALEAAQPSRSPSLTPMPAPLVVITTAPAGETQSASTATPSAATATALFPTVPAPTQTPTMVGPTATHEIVAQTWRLVGVRTAFDNAQGKYRVVGEVENTSAVTQQLTAISGQFFDSAGRLIAGEAQVEDFWPQAIVPAGARAPFELLVGGINAAATYTLAVESVESAAVVRSDFTITVASAQFENNRYCLVGQLQNPGSALKDKLVIVAVLYDEVAAVVNFRDSSVTQPDKLQRLIGAQRLSFRLCVPPPVESVVRYEIKAWGQ